MSTKRGDDDPPGSRNHRRLLFLPPTVPPCLLIPGRTTGSGIKGPEACSPVSFLTLLSIAGRKDGLLTVTPDVSNSVPFERPESHVPDNLRTGGVNHDIHPVFAQSRHSGYAANHRTLRLCGLSCRGKHSLEQLEHSKMVRMQVHKQLEHSMLARSLSHSCCRIRCRSHEA